MTENLQDQLYQLESKQAKGAKLHANIRWKLEGKKFSKTFLKVMIINQNTFSNPKDIIKSAKTL